MEGFKDDLKEGMSVQSWENKGLITFTKIHESPSTFLGALADTSQTRTENYWKINKLSVYKKTTLLNRRRHESGPECYRHQYCPPVEVQLSSVRQVICKIGTHLQKKM